MFGGKLTAIVLSLFTVLPAAFSAQANVVFSSPTDGSACDSSCWTSTSAPDGSFQSYGSFTLTNSAKINEVLWNGFYVDFSNTASNPTTGTTTSWQVSFLSDSGGLPGTALYTTTISATDVTKTLLGTGTFGYPVYEYSFDAALPTTFAADANTTYWFSPLSNQSSFEPLFSWSPGTGTSTSAQSESGGMPYLVADTRAFSLSAVSPLPEPASWTLAILGFGMVGAALRKRDNALAAQTFG